MVVATGDLRNSVARLRALLKTTRYPHAQNHVSGEFSVAELLRVLHHALLDYSRHVATFVLEKGYDLYGKTDARFIDQCFRLMRDEFQYFPTVNTTQFLSAQFLERKIQLVADILDVVVKKHDECVRRRRQEQAVWTKPREVKTHSTHVENHVVPPSQSPTIDTWSLLDHLRREAKANAREQKRAAAKRFEQRRQMQHMSIVDQSAGTRPHEPSARHSTSPTNQPGSTSDATDSNSDTEIKHTNHKSIAARGSADHCGCGCGDSQAEVHEVIVTLGKQLSDLTTAVLNRVSGIESRLERVEQQLQTLQTASQSMPTTTSNQRDPQGVGRYEPISRTKAAYAASSSASGASASRPRSAWPPDPELFNLP